MTIETRICKKCGAEVHGFHRASDCKPAIEMIKRGGIDVMRCTVCGREWSTAENVKHTHEEQTMICENCKQRIDSYAHGLKCERGSFAERVNEIRSENTSGVTFAPAFATEPACKVVDATTDALNTIAAERARLRKIIETQANTIKGMKEAIAPAVIEQAARNERSALAARDVALERADRLDRENDGLHAFRRGILAALHMPENGDAISKVRALMSHDRTDVLERDLAGAREQLDISRRKLDRAGRERDDAIASALTAEREMNEHREARSTAEHRLHLADEAHAHTIKRADITQAALDKFIGAVSDQAVQIMELRSALREVKPDHPMFNGSGSARAGDATPG